MKYKNVGNFDAGIFGQPVVGGQANGSFVMDAAGIQSGNAFLISELEKRDPDVRKPLAAFTYARDIPMSVGGGWVDYASATGISYGMTGGSNEGGVAAGGADGTPIIQASLDNGKFKAHTFSAALRVMFVDLAKSEYIGRSLDTLLTDGVRLAYDKHMDANAYVGLAKYGTTGLLNNAEVTVTNAATGVGGGTTWAGKSADEILADINTAITAAWAAAEYDESAIPNHVLIPYEQYTLLITTKVSAAADKTIMKYVLENNIAALKGKELVIEGTKYCDGAGADSADRMAVYCHDKRFLKMEELVPLTRIMTSPNTEKVCYDTAYMANVTEVEVIYPQTMLYMDGI